MKRLITICAAAIMLLTVNVDVKAVPVTFDFDSTSDGASAIETYMEGIYGSDITVTNATSYGSGLLPLVALYNYPSDRYIADVGTLGGGVHGFSISFNAVQITSVSFDWARGLDPFYAEADGTPVFSDTGGLGGSGFSGPLDLMILVGHAVTTLEFHDSGTGAVGIDNLTVTPIPEPATICLLGLGALSLIRRKRSA